jgi:uncharacterized protein (TIGR02217 family)
MSLAVFPELPTMAWDSLKRQRWDTKVQKYGNGGRKTLSRQAYPEWIIECAYTCHDANDTKKAFGFFAMVRAGYQPFLWKDPEDYHEESVVIGSGDGIRCDFQLIRKFDIYAVEPVRDIVPGTLHIFEDENPATVTLEEDGWVIFENPPSGIITATFDYYWRVAFDQDSMDYANFWYNFYKLNKITLVTTL